MPGSTDFKNSAIGNASGFAGAQLGNPFSGMMFTRQIYVGITHVTGHINGAHG
jgi:hypothetical protein